eukprot:COSAG04_NODE_6232_length_1377_cov_1.372457_1_plen_330_part_10
MRPHGPLLPAALLAAASLPLRAPGAGILTPLVPIVHEPPSFEVWVDGCQRSGLAGCPDPAALAFPLVATSVEASVQNGILFAQVEQQYRNDGDSCLQSRYVFPMPHRAAISGMVMHIGNRTVRGVIRTKEDARAEFEEAQRQGQQASLLDQERPNVFSMELANILPGALTRVVVSYTQTLPPTDGRYAFVHPTVVGPRFVTSNGGWEGSSGDASSLVTDVTLRVAPAAVDVNASVGLVLTQTEEPDASVITTSASGTDCIVEFALTSAAVEASMLLGKKDNDGFFLLAVQPPVKRLVPSDGVSTREYLFILDVSGSMTGYPLELSRQLMD